jgi:chromosome segregation ATPase
MEKKVLSQEELSEIKNLQQQFQDLTIKTGQIELSIMSLQIQKEKIKTLFDTLKQNEQILIKKIEEAYGTKGYISLDTGEFISQ